MDRQSIDRINELARIAKTRPLTQAELAERDKLRKAYVAAFRATTLQTLKDTKVEYEDGSKKSLREHLDTLNSQKKN